jgi:hypothetical protein
MATLPASLPRHLDAAALAAGLEEIRRSPPDGGAVALVVRRPAVDVREALVEAVLDPAEGLVGDTWRARGSRHTEDGSADPRAQLTIMNVRVAALVAGGPDRRELAGDQLFVDLDLSGRNLPPGTRLAIGEAVLEVSAKPHRGCEKFAARFGHEALRFVNSEVGQELNLRGINTRVVVGGRLRVGDPVRKLPA